MDYKRSDLFFPYSFNICTYDASLGNKLRHNCILKYQQQAGEEHLKYFNLDYNTMAKDDMAFIVTNTSICINRMPINDEIITLKTWNRGAKGAKFYRSYNWYSEDGELLIEGSTAFILMQLSTRKILRPDVFKSDMPYDFDEQNSALTPKKIKLPDENTMTLCGERKIKFSEIDANGHLNNSFYTDFVTDYIDMSNKEIKKISIDFNGEAMQGDNIKIYSTEQNGVTYYYGEHTRGNCFKASCEYLSKS